MVEITRKSDRTPLFVWRNVVQISSPVLRWQLCELPTRLNEQWAMDVMHDSLADGTTFRVMTLIDPCCRECLAAVARRRFSGADVASVLAVVGIDRGALPKKIRVENGTEFTSLALDHWAYWNHVELDYSRPGKPADNSSSKRSTARSGESASHSLGSRAWTRCKGSSATGATTTTTIGRS